MTDTPTRITEFRGRYAFLSNFSPVTMVAYRIDELGMRQPVKVSTLEHAFQAEKTDNPGWRDRILSASTATEARRLGRACPLKASWESIKDNIMLGLLRQKFGENRWLKQQLLDTGEAHLEEGNHHGDRYWGTVSGTGKNRLGLLLMQVRAELREAPCA